jgi:hypothetical protein
VAVVGALSRNLSYLQDHQGSLANIYDYPSLILKVLVSFSMMLTM